MAELIVFLALVSAIAGCNVLILRQKRELHALRQKIARISATDDEVMAVLEASDTPFAKSLLAHIARPALPAKSQTEDCLTTDEWSNFLDEFRGEGSDIGRLEVLEDWLRRGYRFGSSQRTMALKLFGSDFVRMDARDVLAEHMPSKPRKTKRKS